MTDKTVRSSRAIRLISELADELESCGTRLKQIKIRGPNSCISFHGPCGEVKIISDGGDKMHLCSHPRRNEDHGMTYGEGGRLFNMRGHSVVAVSLSPGQKCMYCGEENKDE